jgi:protocatechuate 3,4-dioxygenase beta subunit
MRTFAVGLGFAACLSAQQMAPLVGTVVDERGAPVQDAVVVVSRGEGCGFSCLDLDYAHSWREIARAPVDRSGRFGMQLPIGLSLRVEVAHAGHARWRRDNLTPGDRIAIELEAPHTFRGRLVSKSTGKGTPGFLRAWDAVDHTDLFQGRTDAQGNFAFANLPSRPFVCDVEPDEAAAPEWFEGACAQEVLEHDFALDDGAVLTGVVTDADTGEPIAGARIGEGWTMHKAVVTGADGRYTMRGHGGWGRPDVHCRAAGHVESVVNTGGTPARSLDFALQRGVAFAGVVVDSQGQPLRDVYVAAVTYTGNCDWLPARTDAQGRFSIDGWRATADGALLLRRDGFATAVYALRAPGDRDEFDLGRLRLRSPRCVRGVLVDVDGRPVAGAEVSLVGTNDDRNRFAADPGCWRLLSHYLACRTVRTDQNGAFGFGDAAAGSYIVGVEVRDQPKALHDVDVAADVDPEPLRVVMR